MTSTPVTNHVMLEWVSLDSKETMSHLRQSISSAANYVVLDSKRCFRQPVSKEELQCWRPRCPDLPPLSRLHRISAAPRQALKHQPGWLQLFQPFPRHTQDIASSVVRSRRVLNAVKDLYSALYRSAGCAKRALLRANFASARLSGYPRCRMRL